MLQVAGAHAARRSAPFVFRSEMRRGCPTPRCGLETKSCREGGAMVAGSSGTRNSELGTWNSELGTRDSELGTRNSELGTRNSELGTCNLELWNSELVNLELWHSDHGTRNLQLGTRNLVTRNSVVGIYIAFPLYWGPRCTTDNSELGIRNSELGTWNSEVGT